MDSDTGVPEPPAATLPPANHTQALLCIRARWTALQHDPRCHTYGLPSPVFEVVVTMQNVSG